MGKRFFFFFGVLVLVSCAAPSPRCSQDFFGGRLRRVSGPPTSFILTLGWNREGPRVTALPVRSEGASIFKARSDICRFGSDLPKKKTFSSMPAFCFVVAFFQFFSHGLEISLR